MKELKISDKIISIELQIMQNRDYIEKIKNKHSTFRYIYK